MRELNAGLVLEAFASPVHPASAGSAAALTGAMSAALLAKAARSAGDEAAAAQAIALAIKLERLAAIDADALETARTALADADEGGDARRDFSLGQTLAQAAAVPLDVAESCVDVIDLAAFVAGHRAGRSPPGRPRGRHPCGRRCEGVRRTSSRSTSPSRAATRARSARPRRHAARRASSLAPL